MRLDRNNSPTGMGKYALLKLRVLKSICDHHDGRLPQSLSEALALLEQADVVDYGLLGTDAEFMVIRLRDKYAQGPLCEYATAAELDGEWEYGKEIREMASRAGPASKWCKRPD